MIDIKLLEKILIEYSKEEEECTDHSCFECKEIQQLYESDFFFKMIDSIVKALKPNNYHEDILQTFYLGLKLGSRMEKLDYK